MLENLTIQDYVDLRNWLRKKRLGLVALYLKFFEKAIRRNFCLSRKYDLGLYTGYNLEGRVHSFLAGVTYFFKIFGYRPSYRPDYRLLFSAQSKTFPTYKAL